MCTKRSLIEDKQVIVVLEDDELMLDLYKKIFERFDECVIYYFQEPSKKFFEFVQETHVDLFIMDINLPNSTKNGIEISKDIIYKKRGSIFLFVTGYQYYKEDFVSLKGHCVFDLVTKPLDIDSFMVVVSTLLNVASSYKVSFKNTRIKPRESDIDIQRKQYLKLLEKDRLQIKKLKALNDIYDIHPTC